MRSPTMLNDSGPGVACADTPGVHPALAAARTAAVTATSRHRTSRRLMYRLLVVASDAQGEDPVHRCQDARADSPARRIGLLAPQREIPTGRVVRPPHEGPGHLEERHVGHDVARTQVDRGQE